MDRPPTPDAAPPTEIADRALALAKENTDPDSAAGQLYLLATGDPAVLNDAVKSLADRLDAVTGDPTLQGALDYLAAAVGLATPSKS